MQRNSKKIKYMENEAKGLIKAYALIAAIIFAIIASAFLLSSCNVTRTITTESHYWQKGDTTCSIVTKTTEMYDASKK